MYILLKTSEIIAHDVAEASYTGGQLNVKLVDGSTISYPEGSWVTICVTIPTLADVARVKAAL